MSQQPAQPDDMLVERVRVGARVVEKPRLHLDVIVEPPQVDAEQQHRRRPRRRQRQAELVEVAEAVDHPAGVVEARRAIAEHLGAKLHRPRRSGDDHRRVPDEDAAVLIGVEDLIGRAQVERIRMGMLMREHPIQRPQFAGPLQNGFAGHEQHRGERQKADQAPEKLSQSAPGQN
jgi:hypothetical protein